MKRFHLTVLFLLLALALCGCGRPAADDGRTLSVWYAADDPLAPALTSLAERWNGSRERGAPALELRSFGDEAALRRALEAGIAPDLLLCSHALAFTLEERSLLRDPGAGPTDYPAWLTERSACIGHGFYPLGFELQLLCCREDIPVDPEALWDSAAAEGAPGFRLTVDRFAPLFYQYMLDRGTEFCADPARDTFRPDYVTFYNTLSRLCFTHTLGLETEFDYPCRIEHSGRLLQRGLSGRVLRPLSDGALLAEGFGIAVTARDPRSLHALPAFLRWLAEEAAPGRAALSCGLVPALPAQAASAPEALLVSLRDRTLHLPDGSSFYWRGRDAFEARFRASLELLH